jgi:hypothetical protein
MATMPVESLYKIDHFASCVSVLCAQSGWKCARAEKVVEVEVTGRLVMNDLATKLTALLASGELVQILADWAEERFPLYARSVLSHVYFAAEIDGSEAERAPSEYCQFSIGRIEAICNHANDVLVEGGA